MARLKNTHLELAAVDQHRADQPGPILDRSGTEYPFLDLWGWDAHADARMRQAHVVDPARYYPMSAQNQEELVHLSQVTGLEGNDWQNPYSWASRGVLAQPPNSQTTGLVPAYGVNSGATPADVALNARATVGVLDVGRLG